MTRMMQAAGEDFDDIDDPRTPMDGGARMLPAQQVSDEYEHNPLYQTQGYGGQNGDYHPDQDAPYQDNYQVEPGYDQDYQPQVEGGYTGQYDQEGYTGEDQLYPYQPEDVNATGQDQQRESVSSKENVAPASSGFGSLFRRKPPKEKTPKVAKEKPVKVVKEKKPKTVNSKYLLCKVILPDDDACEFELDKRARGSLLLDKVMDQLNIVERDYFGLRFADGYQLRQWLVPDKKIADQLKYGESIFHLEVKFYPTDPLQLHEDLTRYYLTVQIRREISSGRLPCAFVTAALLGSYAVQSELGDYDPEDYGYGFDYIKEMPFWPAQSPELLEKIAELHRTHHNMTPAEADRHYMENATKLALYGVELHDAHDSEGIPIKLGLSSRGIMIFRNKLRINRFAWPKVLKLSYKRQFFYVRLRAGEFEQYEATIGFDLSDHRLAKRIWKAAVEHHAFYRFKDNDAPFNDEPVGLFRFGSKFRYSGRTAHQAREVTAHIERPQPEFERTASRRLSIGSRANSMRNISTQNQHQQQQQMAQSMHKINDEFTM